MIQSKPTSTGASSSDSEPIGLSTDQTPTSSVQITSKESESNRRSIPPEGYLPPHFARLRSIMEQHKVELPFMAEIELIELIYEVWTAGFKERGKTFQ